MRLRSAFMGLLSVSVIGQALPLLMAPVLARGFGAEALGHWALFAAVAANLATVANLRYEYAVLLPKREGEAALTMELALWVAAGMTVVAGTVALALMSRSPDAAAQSWGFPPLGAVWLCLAWVVGLAGIQQALGLWANRQGQFALLARARLWQHLALAIGQSAALVLGVATALGLVMAQAAAACVAPLCLIKGRQSRRPSRLLRVAHARRLWRLACRQRQFPLINSPHAFVNAFQETLVLALIAAWADAATAGHYALMVRLVKAPASLIGGALSEVLMSRLAQDWREVRSLRPRIRQSLLGLLLPALAGALVLVLMGPALFAGLLGSEWRVAGDYARWLAPYVAAHFIVGPLTVVPMVTGRQAGALAFSLVGNALYAGAIASALGMGLDLTHALGLVSLLLPVYFAVFLGWIWQGAEPPRTEACS